MNNTNVNTKYDYSIEDNYSTISQDNNSTLGQSAAKVPRVISPWHGFAFGVTLALSPMTAIVDPSILLRRQETESPAMVAYSKYPVRRISLAEACKLASKLMADAEQERLQAAEDEAARAFILEDYD